MDSVNPKLAVHGSQNDYTLSATVFFHSSSLPQGPCVPSLVLAMLSKICFVHALSPHFHSSWIYFFYLYPAQLYCPLTYKTNDVAYCYSALQNIPDKQCIGSILCGFWPTLNCRALKCIEVHCKSQQLENLLEAFSWGGFGPSSLRSNFFSSH